MSKGVKIALLLLLASTGLVLPAAFSSDATATPDITFTKGGKSILPYIFVILLAVLIICFILLGIAKLFMSQELLFAVQEEILQVFVTLFLVAFCAFGGVNWIFNNLGGDAGLYDPAKEWLDEVEGKALTFYARFVALNAIISAAKTIEVGAVVKARLGGLLDSIDAMLDHLQHYFTIFLTVLQLQKVLLKFGHEIVLTTLLPVGLMLRAIRPMRQAGAVLIAFSLVFYILFPAQLLVARAIYNEEKEIQASEGIQNFEDALDKFFENAEKQLETLSLAKLLKEIFTPMGLIDLLLTPFRLLVSAVLSYLADQLLLFVVLPLVNAIVILVATVGLADFLGGGGGTIRKLLRGLVRV